MIKAMIKKMNNSIETLKTGHVEFASTSMMPSIAATIHEPLEMVKELMKGVKFYHVEEQGCGLYRSNSQHNRTYNSINAKATLRAQTEWRLRNAEPKNEAICTHNGVPNLYIVALCIA